MTNRFLLPLWLATTTLAALSGCTGCESVLPDPIDDVAMCLIDDDCEGTDLCIDGVCQPDSNACAGNADCADDSVCRGGQCTYPKDSGDCTDDGGCAATERCTTSAPENACLVSPECALSEPGTACDDVCWGACVSRPACDDDSDCAVTERCDEAALVCVALGDCEVDSDCPITATCIDGACTDNGDCSSDEDCDGTQSCIDGDCTRNGDCDVDNDCPHDQVCDDTLCVRRDPCASNDDCAVDEICNADNDGGTCVLIGECTTVNDCPVDPEIACLDGVCTRAPCGRDSDCDDSTFCNGAETCDPRVGCVQGGAPSMGRLAPCADEVCDEVNDRLVITPVHARCADNSPCTDDVCVADVGCANPENDFAPAPGPVDDCVQTVCLDGAVTVVNADGETPPAGPTNDCAANVCVDGASLVVAADSEVPPQTSTTDCRRNICANLVVVTVADNTEVLAQSSTTDCRSDVCVDGAPATIANNSEVPPDVGCKDGVCVNGAPSSVVANGNCVDTAVCTNGTCNVDGSCTQTPDDDLCTCAGTQVGLCLPGDPRAPTTGAVAGCVCQQPATLTCGLDDNDDTRRVLERFELFATAPGAKPGTTFVWDLAGVPTGGDAAAQVLSNATSATTAAFQATTPSLTGKDYLLRVTMSEPELPQQTCQVAVRAEPLPDTLQVSLFMNAALDVDVHLTGGVGAIPADMFFHEDHLTSSGVKARTCYWDNCAVCSATAEGQTCMATGPSVDFSSPRNTASYNDPSDPQLDIDNVRGCFTSTNGDLSCVPEKISVETAPAGKYYAWAYLFGNPLALDTGGLTSPVTTTVRLEIECRGVKTSVTRVLRSDTTNGSGVGADERSPRRYGGSNGQVEIVVPTAANAPCIITP